jgi:hypothetical protein
MIPYLGILTVLLVSCNGEKAAKVQFKPRDFEKMALDQIIRQFPDRKERDSLYQRVYSKYNTDSLEFAELRKEFFSYTPDFRERLKKLIPILDSLKKNPPGEILNMRE